MASSEVGVPKESTKYDVIDNEVENLSMFFTVQILFAGSSFL